MRDKGFAPIIFILGILAASGLIIGGSFYIKNIKNSQAPKPAVIFPTPKVDETANWKTYTDNNLNYIFKHPATFKVTEVTLMTSTAEGDRKIELFSDPPLKGIFKIEPVDNSPTSTFYGYFDLISIWDTLGVKIDLTTRKQWCSKLEPYINSKSISQDFIPLVCFYGGKPPEINVNGYKAYEVIGGRDNHLGRYIFISHGDYAYQINFNEGFREHEFQELNSQILSTFKFITSSNEKTISLQGFLRYQTPYPADTGNEYLLELNTPFTDEFSASGEPAVQYRVEAASGDSKIKNEMKKYIGKEVTLEGSMEWGQGESRYLHVTKVY